MGVFLHASTSADVPCLHPAHRCRLSPAACFLLYSKMTWGVFVFSAGFCLLFILFR